MQVVGSHLGRPRADIVLCGDEKVRLDTWADQSQGWLDLLLDYIREPRYLDPCKPHRGLLCGWTHLLALTIPVYRMSLDVKLSILSPLSCQNRATDLDKLTTAGQWWSSWPWTSGAGVCAGHHEAKHAWQNSMSTEANRWQLMAWQYPSGIEVGPQLDASEARRRMVKLVVEKDSMKRKLVAKRMTRCERRSGGDKRVLPIGLHCSLVGCFGWPSNTHSCRTAFLPATPKPAGDWCESMCAINGPGGSCKRTCSGQLGLHAE